MNGRPIWSRYPPPQKKQQQFLGNSSSKKKKNAIVFFRGGVDDTENNVGYVIYIKGSANKSTLKCDEKINSDSIPSVGFAALML